ncbi:unnamed protein product [Protopolystoma xenopodis]|uniref:Uncharacterized protein n=1 Tax=Protopolystoma xenopodis TaxID=117903 RepID=A0A448XDK5_9PLAT|nr:unnamed protein product [Protopolystoma xenopodis]
MSNNAGFRAPTNKVCILTCLNLHPCSIRPVGRCPHRFRCSKTLTTLTVPLLSSLAGVVEEASSIPHKPGTYLLTLPTTESWTSPKARGHMQPPPPAGRAYKVYAERSDGMTVHKFARPTEYFMHAPAEAADCLTYFGQEHKRVGFGQKTHSTGPVGGVPNLQPPPLPPPPPRRPSTPRRTTYSASPGILSSFRPHLYPASIPHLFSPLPSVLFDCTVSGVQSGRQASTHAKVVSDTDTDTDCTYCYNPIVWERNHHPRGPLRDGGDSKVKRSQSTERRLTYS